jgi:hypothetical protein
MLEDSTDSELAPQAIIKYTKYMGGVDISDQKREYGVGRSVVEVYFSLCNKCLL